MSPETISRWIKDELSKAGVDTSVYVSEILKKGGWKSVHTFKIFYSRDIINSEHVDFEFNYAYPILDSK